MAKPLTIQKHFDSILEDVADRMSIVKACKERGISPQTFYDYIETDASLKERYVRAKEDRGDCCSDTIESYQVMLLEGKIDPQTARVLIDTEKWKAGKFNQRMYGDKVQQDVTIKGDIDLTQHFSKDDIVKAGKSFIDKTEKKS